MTFANPDDYTILRTAAARMRSNHPNDPFLSAVADWLDGEAMIAGESENFVDLINASLTAVSGNEVAALRFVKDENGNMKFLASTVSGAVAVADTYLRDQSTTTVLPNIAPICGDVRISNGYTQRCRYLPGHPGEHRAHAGTWGEPSLAVPQPNDPWRSINIGRENAELLLVDGVPGYFWLEPSTASCGYSLYTLMPRGYADLVFGEADHVNTVHPITVTKKE